MFPQEQQLRQAPSSRPKKQPKAEVESETTPEASGGRKQHIMVNTTAIANYCSPDPQTWSEEQLITWLRHHHQSTQPSGKETREELLAMVESAMHTPEAGVGGWKD